MNSYDLRARFYDVDMGANNSGADIGFYASQAKNASGPILELGCGTGRITLPLVQAGCQVLGLDSSSAMLHQLRSKAQAILTADERQRLHLVQADMRAFRFDRRFALVLCPYAAFNYLITTEDQASCLEGVRAHLPTGGRFLVDNFVPHYDLLCRPDGERMFDFRRPLGDGRFLERHKSIVKDRAAQVNVVTRYYRVLAEDDTELEALTTVDRIRYSFRFEMEHLLERHGFQVEAILGDYLGAPYSYEAQMMVFVGRKRATAFDHA